MADRAKVQLPILAIAALGTVFDRCQTPFQKLLAGQYDTAFLRLAVKWKRSVACLALVRLGLELSSSTTSHAYSGTASVAAKLERC
jgi:hypothetical protein